MDSPAGSQSQLHRKFILGSQSHTPILHGIRDPLHHDHVGLLLTEAVRPCPPAEEGKWVGNPLLCTYIEKGKKSISIPQV